MVKRKRLESLTIQLGRELVEGGGGGSVLSELTHLTLSRVDSRLTYVLWGGGGEMMGFFQQNL